jgi:hypothetical protein
MAKTQQHVWVIELRYTAGEEWFPYHETGRGVAAYKSQSAAGADLYQQRRLMGFGRARLVKYCRSEAKRG